MNQTRHARTIAGLGLTSLAAVLVANHAAAQPAPPAASASVSVTAPAPAAAVAVESAPAPEAVAPATEPVPTIVAPAPEPVAEMAPAPVAAEPMPEETAPEADAVDPGPTPSFPSPLKIGVGLRTGVSLSFNSPTSDGAALTMHDGVAHQLNVRPGFSGSLTEKLGFAFNLETTESSVGILDAIIQLKIADEFQIWFGQHIPAMERSNLNGPFYNNSWNLPIVVQTLPFDIAARDRGVTFWGLVADGILKYHLSVVDLVPGAAAGDADGDASAAGLGNARIAARATINLLDPENYYYASGSYYGSQDTLAIGGVVHYQKGVDAVDGSDLDNDLLAFAADIFFEKVLSDAGVLTLNGGYWNFKKTGANYMPNQGTTQTGTGAASVGDSSFLAGASWLFEDKVGVGQLQPNLTLQKVADGGPTVIDAGLGYIVDGYKNRWFFNFRHADPGGDGDAEDMLQIGAQLQL